MLGRLMLAAGVGRKIYGKWKMQQLMSMALTVIVLSFAAAVILTAIVIGGFYAAFHALVGYGISQCAAFLLLLLVAMLIAAGLLDAIRRRILVMKAAMETRSGTAVDSFFDGLFSR